MDFYESLVDSHTRLAKISKKRKKMKRSHYFSARRKVLLRPAVGSLPCIQNLIIASVNPSKPLKLHHCLVGALARVRYRE